MKKNPIQKLISVLPSKTGVYLFLDAGRKIIYAGKALNIKKRVHSHFTSIRPGNFLTEIKKFKYILCDSEIEAIILESKLIKKYKPKFNVLLKDDKNFFFIAATNEEYPRIFITHRPKSDNLLKIIGPFTDGRAIKKTLSLLRQSHPYRSCKTLPKKPCLFYYINRCPACCTKKITAAKYKKTVSELLSVFEGKISLNILKKKLEARMNLCSKKQQYEKAAIIRNQIYDLKKILLHKDLLSDGREDVWLKNEKYLQNFLSIKNSIDRIEGYDVSNFAGSSATASMAVFEGGQPKKSEYRIFRIKFSGKEPNDTLMLYEAISRRLRHKEWPFPQIMLIDGGKGQLGAATMVLRRAGLSKKIKAVSLAKKEEVLFFGKKQIPISSGLPNDTGLLLRHIRDEAHRFAKKYHLKLRNGSFFENN